MVVEVIDHKLEFFPSRVIGYMDNSIDKHEGNSSKNGGTTNIALRKIYGKEIIDQSVNEAYKQYLLDNNVEKAIDLLQKPIRFFIGPEVKEFLKKNTKMDSIDELLEYCKEKKIMLWRCADSSNWDVLYNSASLSMDYLRPDRNYKSTPITGHGSRSIDRWVNKVKKGDIIIIMGKNRYNGLCIALGSYQYGAPVLEFKKGPRPSIPVKYIQKTQKPLKHELTTATNPDTFFDLERLGFGEKKSLQFIENSFPGTIGNLINEIRKADQPVKNEFIPLNQILYGPPGTGKTYNTINKALEIIDPQFYNENQKDRVKILARFNELKYDPKSASGQIAFITFHQATNYEDFIEGIKPLPPGEDGHQVQYDVIPGLFKQICQDAFEIRTALNFDEAYQKYIDELQELGFLEMETPSQKKKFKVELSSNGSSLAIPMTEFRTKMSITKEMIRNYILNGVIDDWKPYTIPISEYIRKKYNIQTETKKQLPYVLIIDEINRGNVSNIFGELITLIEEDKRHGNKEALEAILPYSKQKFQVPSNLFIIGTMNTADRSVEALDTALRRRFCFIEMSPKYDLEQLDREIIPGVSLAAILLLINKRIEKLLDKDHMIGHSYFLEVKEIKDLRHAFQNKIIPLLLEYFYGDIGKIGLVIGPGFFIENGKEKSEKILARFDAYENAEDLEERLVFHLKNIEQMKDKEFEDAVRLTMVI